VGGACLEALARAGIGEISILDADVINASNINRQLIATQENIGQKKVKEWEKRLLSINPKIKIHTYQEFLSWENIEHNFPQQIDYIADAIDTLNPKSTLIDYAMRHKIPIVSSLGSGGKLDPSQIQVKDISKSYGCKLGRMLRKRLYRQGIRKGFKVVFSPEKVEDSALQFIHEANKKTTTGTISYMPLIFGYYLAAEILQTLLYEEQ
jgi:tRNA A37 threonylcarbamoyladenosine dehydratase